MIFGTGCHQSHSWQKDILSLTPNLTAIAYGDFFDIWQPLWIWDPSVTFLDFLNQIFTLVMVTAETQARVAQVAHFQPKMDFKILWQPGFMTVKFSSSFWPDAECWVEKVWRLFQQIDVTPGLGWPLRCQQSWNCNKDICISLGSIGGSNMLYLGPISSWSASGWTLVPNVTPGGKGLKIAMMVPLKLWTADSKVTICGAWCAGWVDLEP